MLGIAIACGVAGIVIQWLVIRLAVLGAIQAFVRRLDKPSSQPDVEIADALLRIVQHLGTVSESPSKSQSSAELPLASTVDEKVGRHSGQD